MKYSWGSLPGNANASEQQQSATSQDSLFTRRAATRLVAFMAMVKIRWRSFRWTFSDRLTSLFELCRGLSSAAYFLGSGYHPLHHHNGFGVEEFVPAMAAGPDIRLTAGAVRFA